ncbi:MAG: hypothetical protein CM1200mP35_08580 [Chloroflexota bacterium]|nr:MAG: hypothetical protein CM1200mP35_08580 [Chloroflexota bacterium]
MGKIVRVYSGSDGESHFEEMTPDQLSNIVNNVGPGDITVTDDLLHPNRTTITHPGFNT